MQREMEVPLGSNLNSRIGKVQVNLNCAKINIRVSHVWTEKMLI